MHTILACSWFLTLRKCTFQENILENKEMVLKNGIRNVQITRTVHK